jgi:hypothetical protein
MLPPCRRAPQHFRLRGVELQSVGAHPLRDVADACGDTTLQRICCTGTAETVDLRIIRIQVGSQSMTLDQPEEVRGVQ